MASILGFLRRNQQVISPPVATKKEGALKFGIISAANIAPIAFIGPAKSHPDVIVHAIAARDKARAIAFAKKHGIPEVKDSYEALLDDPSIDAVYIPLPNGLHFEWTIRALSKGKHVLLEKPSTSNAAEAEILFRSPLCQETQAQPNPPVLMEAFHSRFTPAWACFMAQIDQTKLSHVFAYAKIPSFMIKTDDIRFNYDLAGGSMMDLGTYTIAALRDVFGAEPEECLESTMEKMPEPLDRCDSSFKAKFRFPGGAIGEVEGGLRGSLRDFAITVTATQHPIIVEGKGAEGTETTKTRMVKLVNFIMSTVYHRIEIEDEFTVTNKGTGEVVEKTVKKETKKAYTFREMGIDRPGEVYWLSYRYMLEQFVDRVRGREVKGAWVSHDDSLAQMKVLDVTYEKSGFGPRPTSNFKPEEL